jgi:hypothetical protein
MSPAEFEAVKEVLLRHLHSTQNQELQAALWMLLDHYDQQELRLARLKAGLVFLLKGIRN